MINMNIAIIKPTPIITPSGGVKLQALMWKEGLENLGNQVCLINFWDINDWKTFDIILIIEYGGFLNELVHFLSPINPNIVLAPIIDTNYSPVLFHYAAKYLYSTKLKLRSRYNDLYEIRNHIKLFLVRSLYEKKYITKGLGVSIDKVGLVPLSYRFCDIDIPTSFTKEDFCLHISLMADERKNVSRLIHAAKKYGFQLKLGGKLRNNIEERWLMNLISNAENIEYIGFLNDQDLCCWYKKAKVFALPSVYEGVGMVALEAALYGCDIVLTKNGGPKEYYDNMAFLVDPYSIDDIGKAIMEALHSTRQPQLQKHIMQNFNLNICMNKMVDLFKVLNR